MIFFIIFGIIANCQVKIIAEYSENYIKFDPDDSTFKIIGSKPDKTDNWPYVTALNFYNGTHNNFCVGSLIKTNWIITAAHCIPFNLMEIYGVILRNNLNEDSGFTFMGKLVITHHQYVYDENNITNDIALIRLQNSLVVSPNGIIKLADNPLTKNTICRAFGWGLDTKTKSIFHFYSLRVKVITVSDCIEKMSELIIDDAKICTVHRKQNINSCIGNTGGPLICNGEQFGILSWSPDCTIGSYPIIWTRIEYYLEWINTVIRSETDHEYGDNSYPDLYKVEDLVKDPAVFDSFVSKRPPGLLERDTYYMDQQESVIKEDIYDKEAMENQLKYFDFMDMRDEDYFKDTKVATSTQHFFNPFIARPYNRKKHFTSNSGIFIGKYFLLSLCLIFCLINR